MRPISAIINVWFLPFHCRSCVAVSPLTVHAVVDDWLAIEGQRFQGQAMVTILFVNELSLRSKTVVEDRDFHRHT